MPTTRPRRLTPVQHDPATISRLRWAAGLNQAELARQVGVSRSMICEIEKGKRGITPAMLHKLSAALGVAPSTVMPAVAA